jgi:hypothetical protein
MILPVESAPLPTPVVFVVFNRPDCTAKSLDRIRTVRPRRLYVVADGARPGRPGEAERVRATRAVVDQGVDWACEVRRDYADTNLGCARRVSTGIDRVFAFEEEAIILEDDCVADPSFFPFCAELLGRYRGEPRIGQIAGCSFQDSRPVGASSYYFSRYPHCWGWATWRRAWRHYDHSMQGWIDGRDRSWLANTLEHPAERAIWTDRFTATAEGRIDSWAFRWTMALWRMGALTVLPYQNLVSNIGFGVQATHTRGPSPAAARALSAMRFPLTHPARIERNQAADEHTSQLLFRPASLLVRVRRRLARWLSR